MSSKLSSSNPSWLQPLPLNLKSNTDVSHLYCRAVCGVSVLYCVLRPEKENHS